MNYVITPVKCGPFTRYQLRRGAEYIGEFPSLATCEAMRDASEKAGSDDFIRGYIECVYFTDTGEDGQPESDAPLSALALASIIRDCEAFKRDNVELLTLAYMCGYEAAQAGRDFWFTRNGHGVGYWDRDELRPTATDGSLNLGERLTNAARAFGSCSAYANDDGSIGVE